MVLGGQNSGFKSQLSHSSAVRLWAEYFSEGSTWDDPYKVLSLVPVCIGYSVSKDNKRPIR